MKVALDTIYKLKTRNVIEIVYTQAIYNDDVYYTILSNNGSTIHHCSIDQFEQSIITDEQILNMFKNKQPYTKFKSGDTVYKRDRSKINPKIYLSNYNNIYKPVTFLYYDENTNQIYVIEQHITTYNSYTAIEHYDVSDIFTLNEMIAEAKHDYDVCCEQRNTIKQTLNVFEENHYKNVPCFNVNSRIIDLEHEKEITCAIDQIRMIDKGIRRLSKIIKRYNATYKAIDIYLAYEIKWWKSVGLKRLDTVIRNIENELKNYSTQYALNSITK